MFEQEIHTEKQRLLRLLLSEAEPFVPLQRILALPESELPYKRYFWAEIQWQLYDEELLRQRHPYFDYSAPELQPLLQRLQELLPRYARFPRAELESLVDSAVKVRLNFLCRPRTTLKWFIFRGEPLKYRSEILRRLDYLSDYPYLLTGIRQHIQQLELGTDSDGLLSVVEFERIVQLIDDTVLELTPSQFLQLLKPLESFFRIASLDALPQHLPTAALIIFLDDKGIRFLAHELEELLRRQHLRWISHTQFLDFVARLLEELETPTDPHTLPLEFPSEAATAPLERPEQEPPPAASTSAHSPDPHSAPSPAALGSPQPPQGTPPEEPLAGIAPRPASTLPPADAAPAEELYPEVLTEWLSPPSPDGTIWHDGMLNPHVLQLTWAREFPSDPEALHALPTPPPEHPHEAASYEEHSPQPPSAGQGAPESLVQLLHTPTWRRRYLHSLFPTEEALSHLVQEVLRCAHWKAAAATIDRFFAASGIDPSSRAAVLFREEILRHYSTSEHALR